MIRTIATAATANLAMQLVSVVLGVLIGIVLSHLLGADGLGVYAFAMSLSMLLATGARMGLTTLVVREVAVGQERGAWPEVVGLVSWSQRATAVVATCIGVVTLAVASLTASPQTFWTLTAAMVMLVLMTATTLRSSAIRGLNAVVLASVPLLLLRPACALLGIGVLYAMSLDDPYLAMSTQAVAWAVAGVAALAFWQRRLPVQPTQLVSTPRAWLVAAMPILLLDGLLVTIHQSDILMLKWLSTDASTGIYSIVAQMGRFTALVLMVANSVVSPRFAALHEAGNKDDLQKLVRMSARTVTLLTALLAVSLVVFGRFALSFYAPGFEIGYPALVVLVIGQAANAMAGSVGYLLIMTGHDRDVAWVSVGVALLNFVLNVTLIPTYDMFGAAVASAISVALWNLALVILVRIRLGINSTVATL